VWTIGSARWSGQGAYRDQYPEGGDSELRRDQAHWHNGVVEGALPVVCLWWRHHTHWRYTMGRNLPRCYDNVVRGCGAH
jgi:hypothetical protein